MDRIYYTCKNCSWKSSILAQWADLRPKRCGNQKNCKTSFIKHPEALLVEHSEDLAKAESPAVIENLDLGKDSADALEKPQRKRK